MKQKETYSALVVDDSKEFRELLEIYCRKEGIEVTHCKSGKDLMKELDNLEDFNLLFLDIVMPGMDGFEALARVREVAPTLPVVMATVKEDSESIVRALRLGATDYITKPLDPTRLRAALANALRTHSLTNQVKQLSSALAKIPGIADPIAESTSMKKTLEMVDRVANADTTVLLLGESGTGKEVVSRAIHFRSNRKDEPFVAVNCASVPEGLLDAELFGAEAGIHGSERRRHGKFEVAAKGTLFLDEIGEMSRESQVKLLRVLEEHQIVPVGSNEQIPVTCRIICATNTDLRRAVDEGRFREDLYYRISAYPIEVSPLRERPEDLDALATHFMKRFRSKAKKRVRGFHPDALDAILAYHWPGNVRQLENAIERAVLLTESALIELGDLPEELQVSPAMTGAAYVSEMVEEFAEEGEALEGKTHQLTRKQQPFSPTYIAQHEAKTITSRIEFRDMESIVPLANIERAAILAALKVCSGDILETSKRLKVSRATIYRRLRRYGINPDDTR